MPSQRSANQWVEAWRRMRRQRLTMFCLAIIVLYIGLAIWAFTGVGFPDWDKGDYTRNNEGCSLQHWLGTDIQGQDILFQTIYGTRVALTVATVAALLAAVIGTVLGTVAGFFGGIIDELITWLYSTLASIPGILLLMAFAFVLKDKQFDLFGWHFRLTGINAVYLALGLTGWVGLCRLIRGEVIKHRDRDYIVAARAIGVSNSRILFRYLIPNVFHLVIITFSLSFVGYIHAEVILTYLGLGVVDVPSWGKMIRDGGQELAKGHWQQLTAAAVAIFIISYALHIFGDALRDALDPKLRGEGI
ncbi:MAG: Oligopeptide transport system permease protein OppC [Phycisphaerae bacterium]|nr:Oligopeptide transport system permease protein OppC [Phycisphaerae bacterium]